MKLLNRLTVNDLKLNRKRTAVTVIGIMLSVALITAVSSVFASGLRSVVSYEMKQKGKFHAMFFDVPVDELSVFRNNRGVETINVTSSVGYADIGSKNEDKPYVFIKGFTQSSLENLSVRLVEGRLPENENEVLIPTHLKTNGRVTLSVGEVITLDVGNRTAADGSSLGQRDGYRPKDEEGGPQEYIAGTEHKTYTVTGIIERPASNIEPYTAPGYTLITRIDGSQISGNTDVYVRYTKSGVKKAARLTAGILGIDGNILEKAYKGTLTREEFPRLSEEFSKAKYEFEFNSYLVILETDPLSITGISSIGYAAAVVVGIIVAASIFCIKNSFDISITEKIRQYGMLRSVGATRKQIRRNVFFEATVLGAYGLPLGILLGAAASYILIIVSNHYLDGTFTSGFKLAFVFPWQTVALAVLLGAVTLYFSAFGSAGKAAGVTPLDSIRGSREISVDPKKISSPGIIRKLFGVGGEISYKNLKRSRRKYRTTVISVTVSAAVFISLSSFMSMAFKQADLDIERIDYNICVNARSSDPEEYAKLTDTTKFDNIQEFSVIRTAEMEFEGLHYSAEYLECFRLAPDENASGSITVLCVGDEQFSAYCSSLGLDAGALDGKAVLCDYSKVNEYSESGKGAMKYIRKHDFKKGGTVDGSIGDQAGENKTDVRIEIAEISEKRPFGLKNWSSPFMVVSDAYFDSIAETTLVSVTYKTNDSDKLQDEIEAYMQGCSVWVTNKDENYRETTNLFTLIGIFLYGFIIVISLIGITNIFNTITTNMELRKPEFAMLRSVGMTNKEFNRMIRLESIFIGTRALLFGVPAGVVLSYIIYYFMAKEAGIPFRLPLIVLVIAVLAVFLLISLIMAYSMGKIKKQNTIETIRNENI